METSNFSPYRPNYAANNNNNHPSTSAAAGKRPQQPLFIPPGQVAFRILGHASRVGGLIGKSGSIIKNIQQLTNTKIRVDEPPNSASADYRVISVIGSPIVSTRIKVSLAVASGEAKEEELEHVQGGENDDSTSTSSSSWFDVSAAQDGVLKVFERVMEVATEGDSEATFGGVVSLRILAGKTQVGAVIGKGGMVVERIRRDTGCKIKVLISDKLPSGPFPNEEIVEIEGELLGVKKALLAVTGRLQEFPPPPERTRVNSNRPPEAESLHAPNIDLAPQSSPVLKPTSNTVINSYGNGPSTLNSEAKSNTDFTKRRQEMVFKILCPNDRIGCIIGKGGSIIRSIQSESGAYINIGPVVAECNERLITIHAMENVESQYSPVQKAAVLVFSRFMEGSAVTCLDSDSKGSPVMARVVVPDNQVGCLLGKAGSIISEMRKATGTGLKIFADNLPKCASENVEILQITGELANVRDAIHRVVGRLRGYTMSQMSNGGVNRDALRTENSPYNRKDPPAPMVSPVILDSVNEHDSLTQRMDHLGISNNIDRSPAYSLQASIPDAGSNMGNLMDGGRRYPPNNSGTELGRSAIVMNTTVEISVPENVMGSIYGDNGSNLVRLRQISGAKVTVNEPLPGATDRMVIISGSPDETQVAQSLLQAFMLSGSA